MNPSTETKLATFFALALGAASPTLLATEHLSPRVIAAIVCGAIAAGIGGAYHVRTAADRAATRDSVPPSGVGPDPKE